MKTPGTKDLMLPKNMTAYILHMQSFEIQE